MSTAVYILLFMALSSVAGTLIEQNLSDSDYIVIMGEFWSEIFSALSIFNLYSAWWFLGCLVFLLISVNTCIVVTGGKIIRSLLNPKSKFPKLEYLSRRYTFSGKDKLDEMQNFLKLSGYKLRAETEKSFYYQRGVVVKYGYFLLHVGIVVLAIAGLLSGIFGYRGIINLRDGESANVATTFSSGKLEKHELPFTLTSRGFEIQHYQTGMPKGYSTQLEIKKDTKKTINNSDSDSSYLASNSPRLAGSPRLANVSVNHPARVGKYSVYQSSFGDGGSQVDLQVRNLLTGESKLLQREIYQKISNSAGYSIELVDLREHNIIDGEDIGAAIDYILRGADIEAIKLRSYQNSPNLLSLLGDNGEETVFLLGDLSIFDGKNAQTRKSRKDSYWKIIGEYLTSEEALSNINTQDFMQVSKSKLLKYPEEERVAIAMSMLQTVASFEELGRLPYLVTLQNYEKKYYTALQVSYDLGIAWFWVASIMLTLGTMAMLYFSHDRVYLMRTKESEALDDSSKSYVYKYIVISSNDEVLKKVVSLS